MDKRINAVHVNDLDSCVTAVAPLKAGDTVYFYTNAGDIESVVALGDVPIYHKIACKETRCGEYVIKYGENIGVATADIRVGDYVHIHNLKPVGVLK